MGGGGAWSPDIINMLQLFVHANGAWQARAGGMLKVPLPGGA